MTMLDANIILRYLFDDNEEMAGKAAEYIEDGNAVVSIEVIAEVIYVLKGVYSLERTDISRTITEFLKLVGCSDMNVLSLAVQTFGIENLDFVDCVLFAYHKERNMEIATFDKKLLKLLKTADSE
jgi:predicted nucleic-acid-binding protein